VSLVVIGAVPWLPVDGLVRRNCGDWVELMAEDGEIDDWVSTVFSCLQGGK
jgi:hypothetical protein